MKISVAPLLKQPYGTSEEYDLGEDAVTGRSEHAGLLDAGVRSVHGVVRATHTQPGVYVEGDLGATVELECSRCLARFDRRVSLHLGELYYTRLDVLSGARLPDPPRDAYTIGHDFLIDFTPLVREHVLLELPPKPLHDEACRGICPICGVDQNQRPHRHEAEPEERLAKLRTLLADFHAERQE